MTRCTTILIMCVALLAACGSPRKACRKADRHIARAIWLCPDVLSRDSATATLLVPGDSTTGALTYTQHDLDSLLAACDSLRGDVQHTDTLPAQVVYVRNEKPRAAVQRFRSRVCRPEPVHEDTDQYSVRIWMDSTSGEIRYLLTIWPQVVEQKVPCDPVVSRPDKTLTEKKEHPWYAYVLLVLLILAGLWIISWITSWITSWDAWD